MSTALSVFCFVLIVCSLFAFWFICLLLFFHPQLREVLYCHFSVWVFIFYFLFYFLFFFLFLFFVFVFCFCLICWVSIFFYFFLQFLLISWSFFFFLFLFSVLGFYFFSFFLLFLVLLGVAICLWGRIVFSVFFNLSCNQTYDSWWLGHVEPDDVVIADIGGQALDIFLHGPKSALKNGIVKTFTHTIIPIHPRTLLKKQKQKTKAQLTEHSFV